MRNLILTGAVIVSATLAGAQVRAQTNPSADDITCSLRPDGCPKTRGIHLGRPPSQLPETPAAVTPSQQGPQAAQPGAAPEPATAAGTAQQPPPSVNLTVQFKTNSAELTPPARHTLDELGRALSSPTLAPYHFRIEGHTDTVGSRDANRALSERRAAAVVDYLSNRFGVDRARLEAVGLGEDNLLVSTPPQTPEPRNRRVQVVNTGA